MGIFRNSPRISAKLRKTYRFSESLRNFRKVSEISGKFAKVPENFRKTKMSTEKAQIVHRRGRRLHGSHALSVFRGLFFCRLCGCYATAVPKLLKLACEKVPNTAGRFVLRRLAEGRLPPGVNSWPSEDEVPGAGYIELQCLRHLIRRRAAGILTSRL